MADFPAELRESNTTIDGVLRVQGDQVQEARDAAVQAAQDAQNAAGLVGTPPDTAIAAAVNSTNSETRHALSRGKDFDRNPALGKLWANLTRCQAEPIRVVYLGSSSTAAPLDDPSDRWTNHLTDMMQVRFASNYGAEKPTGDMTSPVWTAPGIYGYNLGISGATTRTYLPAERLTRIHALQPGIVFHAIGSNDARLGYSSAEVKQNVLNAIAAIDTGLTAPATHVIIHMHERDDADISARWAEYREEYRANSIDYPHSVAFINIADHFAAIGIPGADPYGFRKTDRVHLEPTGLHMTGKLIAERLGINTEQRQKRLLAFDSFGRPASPDLGMADTGQRWLYASGFGINGDKAATDESGGGNPLVDVGTPDMDVSVNMFMPDNDTLAGIAFRSINDNNRYTLLIAGGATNRVSMFAHRNGEMTNRWNVSMDFPEGTYNIRVSVKGREMQTFINGNLVYVYRLNPIDEAVLGRATRAGLRCGVNSSERRWSDFRVIES